LAPPTETAPPWRELSTPDDLAQVEVPAGPFLMGRWTRDLFARSEEKPSRIVTLDAFAIDVHPVTNRRYRAFVDSGGYDKSKWWSRDGWRWLQSSRVRGPASMDKALLANDDQPVCGVSWHEADAFCRFVGRRLPTSAEWERAARGQDGRRYPWGDALPDRWRCNFDDRRGSTSPIGSYPAGVSPAGIHDAAGNVNNWVQDVYWTGFGAWCEREDRLKNPVLDEPLAVRLGIPLDRRMDRGGGYLTTNSMHEVLATTCPLGWDSGSRELWHGFRTARSLDAAAAAG
jgi:formylglycine-generating enzyme required for sulfatase activity